MAHGNKKYSGKMGIKALYIDLDVYDDLNVFSKYNGYGSFSMMINDLMKVYRDENIKEINVIKNKRK